MTALQTIIKEAKAIRNKNPKMEWKKAVAQASAIYAKKHKGKSPVGKKKVGAVKKKSAKKKVVKMSASKSHTKWGKVHAHERRVAGVKKKVAKKSAKHIDTKSHNVNIRVMSGISGHNVMDEIKSALKKIEATEKYIIHHKLALKNPENRTYKAQLKKQLEDLKKYVKEQKTHIVQLKKHIK